MLDEAEERFRRVVQIDPQDADALFNLGSVLEGKMRFEDAARIYRSALEMTPDNGFLWLSLGRCHEKLGEEEQTLRCLRRSIELQADIAEAHDKLGGALLNAGRVEEACQAYRDAVRLSPGLASAHNNLGCVLVRLDRLDEGADCFGKAIALQPAFGDAHFNLGHLRSLQGEHAAALDCYQLALKLQPDHPLFVANALIEAQHLCDWACFAELCDKYRRNIRASAEPPAEPFTLLSIPSTRAEQLQCARHFTASVALRVGDQTQAPFVHERAAKERLTIGYLSADLHEHVTAHCTAEMFELHDRRRFRVIAYSYGPDDGSPMRNRLRKAFDRFVDIRALSHRAAAAAVHADGVDILVDLKGYTLNARTEIVALRPAPVQVSFVGYPGTMGADFIDYLVADRFVAPPEHGRDYLEKLVYMPGRYVPTDCKRVAADTRPRGSLGLPENAFVFCCFNQTYKILPDVFAVWMRLLGALPGSVLWLLESNRWVAQNLRREAAGRGVDPARVIFAPELPHDLHLARIGAADLMLDTLPYNAHTTTSDALWAGLPVVTCAGDTFASRVAGSLLTTAGMPEMVTRSMTDYEALALRLATDPGELGRVREKLARNRLSTPLFDTPRFTRDLESAYVQMWRNLLAFGEPRPIDLTK